MTFRDLILATLTSFLCSACAGEDSSDPEEGGSTSSGEASAEEGTSGGDDAEDSTGTDAPPEGQVRGTIVWLDGTQTDVELEATHRRFEFGDVVQHSCGGQEIGVGYALSVTWRAETTAGTHAVSSTAGPTILAAWPMVDGDGIRATQPGMGEVTFDRVGVEVGDVVEGTAHAVLTPEADDPDDRVREIVDIEFQCVVSEDG